MNLVYFITGLQLGGAETITVDIANHMVLNSHNVTIFYLSGDNHFSNRMDKNIELINLNITKNPLSVFIGLLKAIKKIKKITPDVVHSNMYHSNIFTRLMRIFCKIPLLICSEHSNNIGSPIRLFTYRLTDSLSDLNTNVSNQAVNYFVHKKAFKASNSFIMYNGIDMQKFCCNRNIGKLIRQRYKLEDDDFLFLSVGRLTKAKDHKNLITSFSMLGKGKLMIVGYGELEIELKQLVSQLKLNDKIIFMGKQTNAADYYNAADCFVLSSAWEGFGIVLAEAMASELPVITTNAGGCSEVCKDPSFVVPVHNTLALRDKMNYIYNLPLEERKNLGKRNRDLAKQFDLDQICNDWESIYSQKSEHHIASNLL